MYSTFCDELCKELGLIGEDMTWDPKDIAILVVELIAFVAMVGTIGSKVRHEATRPSPYERPSFARLRSSINLEIDGARLDSLAFAASFYSHYEHKLSANT